MLTSKPVERTRASGKATRWLKLSAGLAALTMTAALLTVVPATAQTSTGPVLPPQASADCTGDVPVAVASDARAQSDIYAAALLAAALGTDCIILAGARDEAMPDEQLFRLLAALPGGYVVGATAAVPVSKPVHRDGTVLVGGADRWATIAQVGQTAAEVLTGEALPIVTVTPDMADDDMADEMSMTPGEGVSVTMGRADWSTGYFQAELYRQMLEELGYDVSDPAELELGPNNGYIAMAEGQMDFWANSWYPGHLAWLAGELPDGTLVGDHLTILGEELVAGGLQGFLVTKSFADEFGVYTLDALNADADALAAFDATDPVPDNGIADIFGCPESWTCDNIITAQIAFSGWENINQTIAGYDAMFAQAVDAANEGVPMVAYTWTPSAYITQLRPGDNVYWIGVDAILDDSNPTGDEGGEKYDQTGDGSGGYAAIGPDQCPAAADNADGLCPIGWIAADILVTANNDFLGANPAAASLLEAVKLSVIEVSLANVEQGEGASPDDLAAAWIENNRSTVDAWLEAARAAA